MMRIRPDQMATFAHGYRAEHRLALVAQIRSEHPERAAEAPELADQIIADADMLAIEINQWPRLVSLLGLSEEQAAGTLGGQIFAVLANPQRAAAERLDFIERYLMPRLAEPTGRPR
ncbi:MAG: hypothetical protein R3B72_27895 [Polyangiaceae bacterium]